MYMKTLIPKVVGFYFNVLALFLPRVAGKKGFFFFCTPFGAKVKPHQLNFLNSAERIEMKVNNTSIQVYKWGTGKKVILFLHGWQSHSFRWKNYAESLSTDEYTLYALDAPAHGLSGGHYLNVVIYSNVLEQFIRQTGPIDTIVSHSLGGMTTVYTLSRLPALPVEQVVITGMPTEVKNFIHFYKGVLGLWDRTARIILDYFRKEIGHAPDYFSMASFVPSINRPCLIIHDRHDPDAPYADILDVHERWKDSQLITTENLGHNLRSKEVVQAVVDFVARKKAVVLEGSSPY